MSQRPTSMRRATQLHWALVLLGLVTTVLAAVRRDDLVRAWAEGNSSTTRKLLASGGVDAVRDGPVTPPAFVPVGIVLFVVLALMIWVLLAFLAGGNQWARLSLTVLLLSIALGIVTGIRIGAPDAFVALCVVGLLIEAGALVFLWHPDTSAYVAGTWQAERQDA